MADDFKRTTKDPVAAESGHLLFPFDSTGIGNQKVLPPIVIQNKVLITLLVESVFNFKWNARQGIHIILDRAFLTHEGLKLDFPSLH